MSRKLSNLRTFPVAIPELSTHRVLSCVDIQEAIRTNHEGLSSLDQESDGGYLVTLECPGQHTVWSESERQPPFSRMYCGACAANFIDRLWTVKSHGNL